MLQMIIPGLLSLGSKVITMLTKKSEHVVEKQKIQKDLELRTLKAKGDAKIAEINKSITITNRQADADELAIQNNRSSIIDEILVLIIMVPVILCFVPYMQPFVKQGFAILSELPVWFQVLVILVYVAKLGVRQIFSSVFSLLKR